jgi:hypothetical protein
MFTLHRTRKVEAATCGAERADSAKLVKGGTSVPVNFENPHSTMFTAVLLNTMHQHEF